MSNQQCCRSINNVPLKCGTSQKQLNEAMLSFKSKNKDIETRGGYYKDLLIRDNKTILVNFNQPANTAGYNVIN